MVESGIDERSLLRADCSRCVGLCCVALPFARSADFAFDKPAGMPCPHLRSDDGCEIHARLRPEGFRGCAVFDCFGAGQQVTQVTFGGASWREGPAAAEAMFATLPVLQAVHEMRWLLADAAARDLADDLRIAVASARHRLQDVSALSAHALTDVDVSRLRAEVGPLLDRVSAAVRARKPARDLSRQDLSGRSLQGEDLRGANLRGALLLAANLRGADLRLADLLGADLRDADLRAADLLDALFLTRPQLAAAWTDERTRIPAYVAL